MTVLRFDDNRGGLTYPFLPEALQWQIASRPFSNEAELNKILTKERTRVIVSVGNKISTKLLVKDKFSK